MDAGASVTVNGSSVTSGDKQVVPLNIGNNVITIVVTAAVRTTQMYTVTVTRESSNSSGSNGSSGNNNTTTSDLFWINGKTVSVGTISASLSNGQTVNTLKFDFNTLAQILEQEGEHSILTIQDNNNSDVFIGELNGSLIQLLQQYHSTIQLVLSKGNYTLPIDQFGFEDTRVISNMCSTWDTSEIKKPKPAK